MLVPILVTPPVKDPVTLEEAKAHLSILEDDGWNGLIEGYIKAATSYLDGYSGILGRCLITQTWKVNLCSWPASMLELPLSPVQPDSAIVRYWYTTQLALGTSNYRLHVNGLPPYLEWTQTVVLPTYDIRDDAIEVEFVCGYGDNPSDVPAAIRHAIMLLIAHWFENREPVNVGNITTNLPLAFDALIAPFRRVGF